MRRVGRDFSSPRFCCAEIVCLPTAELLSSSLFFLISGSKVLTCGVELLIRERGRGNQDRPFDSNRSMSNPSIKSLLTLDEVKRRINHQLPSCSRGKKTKTNPSSKSLISRHTHIEFNELLRPCCKNPNPRMGFRIVNLNAAD